MAFNPKDHMMKLKGKDYLEVKWRLVWFREDHPDFGIHTEPVSLDDKHAIFRAYITDATGRQVSSGTGSESIKDFGDFIEKAETKAVGRALAMLGYGTQFDPDMEEGHRIVDSPVETKITCPPTAEANISCPPPSESNITCPPRMATDAQVRFITKNASADVCMAMMAKYGTELEKLTYANAEKAIAKLKGATNE